MPSTYTPNRIYELMATGENTGTWGTLLNAVLSIIDLNLGGRLALNVAGAANVTLTTTQERNTYILMTGILTGSIDLIFTATNGGFYLLDNRSTGSFTITAKPSGGTGVVIPQGAKCLVMIDPDNTRAVIMDLAQMMTTRGDMIYRDANGVQRLAVGAQGSVPYANANDPAWLAPGTSGQFLKTQGAAANPIWATLPTSGLVLLTSGTVTAAATLDLVLTSYSAYRGLKIFLSGFLPATDNADLYLRTSTDGGGTYSATGYNWSTIRNEENVGNFDGNGSDVAIKITGTSNDGVGNVSTEGIDVEITLMNFTSAAFWGKVFYTGFFISSSGTPGGCFVTGGGAREAAQDTDAIRLLFSAGNIAAGNYAVYGLS